MRCNIGWWISGLEARSSKLKAQSLKLKKAQEKFQAPTSKLRRSSSGAPAFNPQDRCAPARLSNNVGLARSCRLKSALRENNVEMQRAATIGTWSLEFLLSFEL
jgi:hypothetical protein